MGKIFDAFEKRKKEKAIHTKNIIAENKTSEDTDNTKLEYFNEEKASAVQYNPKLVVITEPDSLEAENFKTLRAQILFPVEGKRRKIIMITSVFPGEGKTFVSANLAASIAQGINEHVLLVDCDLRKPHLHKMLSYSNTAGLSEHLVEKTPLENLIINTAIQKLSLLSAGRSARKPSELLASKEMKDFLVEVKERYDDRFIIVDSAPLQVTSEANILTNFVDGVLLVVRAGKTPKETIKKNIEKFGKDKIIGIVFNGYEQHLKRYEKYYKGYYQ